MVVNGERRQHVLTCSRAAWPHLWERSLVVVRYGQVVNEQRRVIVCAVGIHNYHLLHGQAVVSILNTAAAARAPPERPSDTVFSDAPLLSNCAPPPPLDERRQQPATKPA